MNAAIDFLKLKQRAQSTWASGDHCVIGITLQIVDEMLAEACDLRADERVLDVAAGSGNSTLAAARRGCRVISTDCAPGVLKRAAARARAEHPNVTFRLADTEALPFPDASFDAVLSGFGVTFSVDHIAAASELIRVCRPGGRIGVAAWTPTGFMGQLFRLLGRHAPSPAGVQAPAQWGDALYLHTLFGDHAAVISTTKHVFRFRYRSAAHFIETFRSWYGPVHEVFSELPEDRALVLERELTDLLQSHNQGGIASLIVPSEYLQVVITRSF